MAKYLALGDNTVVVYHPVTGTPVTITSDDADFNAVIEALQGSNDNILPELLEPERAILAHDDRISIVGNTVFLDGERVDPALEEKFLRTIALGLSVQPWVLAFDDLKKNPSFRIREQFFRFMADPSVRWNEDGSFQAFKVVRSNMYDKYSGTIYNGVNKIVWMDRSQVDDDPRRTCSSGLHVCNAQYIPFFYSEYNDDVIIAVKVWPRHVVSIPADHSDAKMRVEEYFVEAIISEELIKELCELNDVIRRQTEPEPEFEDEEDYDPEAQDWLYDADTDEPEEDEDEVVEVKVVFTVFDSDLPARFIRYYVPGVGEIVQDTVNGGIYFEA